MKYLTDEARMSLVLLFREIMQNRPPLTHLSLYDFIHLKEVNESEGDIILKALLNSSISTIQNLNLG